MQTLIHGGMPTVQHVKPTAGSQHTNSKISATGSESGSEPTFDQLLGSLLGHHAIETANTDSEEKTLEELLTAIINKSSTIFSKLEEIMPDKHFQWSDEMRNVFDQLPDSFHHLSAELEGLPIDKFITLMKDWLSPISGIKVENPLISQIPDAETVETGFFSKNERSRHAAQSFIVILALKQWSGELMKGLDTNEISETYKGNPSLLQQIKEFQQLFDRTSLLNQMTNKQNLNNAVLEIERLLQNQLSEWSNSNTGKVPLNDRNGQYLQSLLTRNAQSTDKVQTSNNLSSSFELGAMNKIQQMTLYLGDKKTEHTQSQQFIKQLQDILGKSSLQSFRNGSQQLSIKLYPEHLGRLDVKLIQQNGQIQAQLLTTTKIAKEMVESQIHQLRQTFHQQNIPIERIIIEDQPSYLQQESEQQESRQNQSREKESHEQSDSIEEKELSFSDILDDITFNERA